MTPVNSDYEGTMTRSHTVVPHATNEAAPFLPKMIYVGGTGNITCRLVGDTADVVINSIPAGSQLPLQVQYIRATGTTATNIRAFG